MSKKDKPKESGGAASQTAAQLWKSYAARKDPQERERLILEYAPLVRYVVDRLGLNLPAYLDRDDLVGHGIIGLMDAVDHFDPSLGTQFRTYAVQRIRGQILDALRALDLVPRSARRWQRQLEAATAELYQALGRAPSEEEMALEMKVDLETYRRRLTEMAPSLVPLDEPLALEDTPLEESLGDPQAVAPEAELEEQDLREHLRQALLELPERQRLILSLYYNDELTLKEIGAIIGVSESRISQILTQTIVQLRAILAPVALGSLSLALGGRR